MSIIHEYTRGLIVQDEVFVALVLTCISLAENAHLTNLL